VNNLCIDHHRRHRHERREHSLADTAEALPDDRPADPVAALNDREMREALLRAVDELPEEQKQVFLMREEAGLPFKEIARIVGCPINTALGRMHYAMEHIRNSMKAFREE
jgi:RNA polymerase sigma-70 factor (ECF subfamily)